MFFVWDWSLLPLSGNICKHITSVKKARKVYLLDQEVVQNFLTSPDASLFYSFCSWPAPACVGPDLLPLTLPQGAAAGTDFLVS